MYDLGQTKCDTLKTEGVVFNCSLLLGAEI